MNWWERFKSKLWRNPGPTKAPPKLLGAYRMAPEPLEEVSPSFEAPAERKPIFVCSLVPVELHQTVSCTQCGWQYGRGFIGYHGCTNTHYL